MKTLILVALAITLCFTPAWAEFPERPITILVGFGPGGTIDLITRALATKASGILNQQVIVENRGGGGGSVALGVVAAAKPDGYTLCTMQNASIVDTALLQKVPYRPLASFTPILAFAASDHSALLVAKDAPWRTMKEFVDFAKQNPGKIKYGTSGVGTGMHVAMEMLAKQEKINWVHIPYKTSVDVRTAALGKHIDAVSSGTDWVPFVKSGDLRVLGTHGAKRCPQSPDVPTFKEMGYLYVSEILHCAVGPAGMPADVVAKLEAAFTKAMESTEFNTVRDNVFLSPAYMSGKDYAQSLKERWAKMEEIYKEIGLIKEPATQPY